MFGAEPRERLTKEDGAEFEAHVTARTRRCQRTALKVGMAFVCNILSIVPFLAGQPLHRYWGTGRYLLFPAGVLLGWFVVSLGSVWASWQSARETRREFDVQ